jgi:hypothetical protein
MITDIEKKRIAQFLEKDKNKVEQPKQENLSVVNSFAADFKNKKMEKVEKGVIKPKTYSSMFEEKNQSELDEINKKIKQYIWNHRDWHGRKDVVIFEENYNGFNYKLIISDEIC